MLQKVHHVLVIEDDPVTIEVIQGALEQFNFRVSTVSDGQLALSKLRTYSYDLVLCDIMLPHLDGLNALERAREKLHATPIVMVTALSDKDSVLRAREIGAEAFPTIIYGREGEFFPLCQGYQSYENLAHALDILHREPPAL